MLKKIYISLLSDYVKDREYIEKLWVILEKEHEHKNRYYHNISHLEHLYKSLLDVKNEIADWEVLLFALFYHDFIYNVLKQNNEEKSAQKATEIMKSLSIQEQRIVNCKEIILATKGHQVSTNPDVNYFTNADLSILGVNWDSYQIYYQKIRKEYKYYPDFMYYKGRIKVLKHFLEMPRIFKTDHFFNRFETQAKNNLQNEIKFLSK